MPMMAPEADTQVLGRALKEREDAMATVLSNVASVPEWQKVRTR